MTIIKLRGGVEVDTIANCPGSDQRWGVGTTPGQPICPVCHRGPGSLNVSKPTRVRGRFVGRVPPHLLRVK